MRGCDVCNGTGKYLTLAGDYETCYKCSFEFMSQTVKDLQKERQNILSLMDRLIKNEEYRILLYSLSQSSPIMMWAKDVKGRYTYANQALADHLYHGSADVDLIGKTDGEIMDSHRLLYPNHTFGSLCLNTDALTLQEGKACKWYEWGVVRNNWENVIAYKNIYTDVYDKVQGTVGLAWYVTEEVKEISEIMLSTTDEVTRQKLLKYLERFGFGQENTFSEGVQ